MQARAPRPSPGRPRAAATRTEPAQRDDRQVLGAVPHDAGLSASARARRRAPAARTANVGRAARRATCSGTHGEAERPRPVGQQPHRSFSVVITMSRRRCLARLAAIAAMSPAREAMVIAERHRARDVQTRRASVASNRAGRAMPLTSSDSWNRLSAGAGAAPVSSTGGPVVARQGERVCDAQPLGQSLLRRRRRRETRIASA